jgi:Protein of unknown function (DUF3014)
VAQALNKLSQPGRLAPRTLGAHKAMNSELPDTAHAPSDARPFKPQPGALPGLLRGVVGVALLCAAGLAAYFLWRQGQTPRATAESAAVAASAAAAPSAAQVASEPAILHPIQAAADAPSVPPSPREAEAWVVGALAELLGSKAVGSKLQTDGFVRRVVATLDNLDRAHAAPMLWPVQPAAGRFTVQAADGVVVIAAANAARHAAFVNFIESVDTPRAATLYVRLYPLFQQAYVELGYPRGYFNDRVVAVIDRLLATPEPAQPIAVRLTEVKGPIAPERPWLRYEFADPALEALPAGSKMLLRVGPENARRLKAKLLEFRGAIARKAAAKP